MTSFNLFYFELKIIIVYIPLHRKRTRVPPPLPALTMTSRTKRAPKQRGHVTTTVPINPTKCANEGTRGWGRRSHGRPGRKKDVVTEYKE